MFLVRAVSGMSMSPVLQPGNIVLAKRRPKDLRVGDVVIVEHNGLDKIKRIRRLGADKVYVEGDNKRYSTDSRQFGWLPRSSVRGKVIWPKTQISKPKRSSRK
jgi:phage repressor protein C with HTH and peptisase S24 domain